MRINFYSLQLLRMKEFSNMQDRTKEWIRYAENDFKAAENLSIVLNDYNNAI
jgi:hypothetical protein